MRKQNTPVLVLWLDIHFKLDLFYPHTLQVAAATILLLLPFIAYLAIYRTYEYK